MGAGVCASLLTLYIADSFRPVVESEPMQQVRPATASKLGQLNDEENPEGIGDEGIEDSVTQPLGKRLSLEQLHEQLREASLERTQLADSLAQLNRQVTELESDVINQGSRLAQSNSDVSAGGNEVQFDTGDIRSGIDTESGTQIRYDSLIAAGVDPQIVAELHSKEDNFQLQRLELFDLAEREGWIDTDDFSDRLDALEEQQVDWRAELGDAAYDRYLYELGRNNRVSIASIINGSAAQIAGLQRGDVIISYANDRIFSTRDLQAATRSGQRGEIVQIVYERSGQTTGTDIPRGPLGVTLTTSRREPS
jgi:hypothetical protein